jgi:protein TonB
MTVDPYGRERAKDTALWTVAALLVAAAHVGLVAAYVLLRPVPEGVAEAPVIDVAFVPAAETPAPAAPEAKPAEPTPPVEQSDPTPPKDEPVVTREAVKEPEPPPPAKAETVPPPEPVPPPVALQAPEPTAEPVRPDQITVMPPPPPKPAEQTPEAKKPAPVPERAAHKPVTDEKADKEKKQKTAPPKPAAAPGSRPAQLAMAPNPGTDSEGARAGRASWESEVAAHIRRYATYSANGSRESGTVRVGVTIDRNGRLVSRRLAGTSGSSVLDSAAMAVIARAAPYPRFPPGMNQAQIALTIPLHLRPQ